MNSGKVVLLALAVILSLSAPAATLAAGRLTLDKEAVEFGSMREGPAAREVVRVTNGGDAPVTIVNVTTSCSCTSTVLGKATLAPGEATTLEIVYNTFKFPGKFEKYVNLFWGEGGAEKSVVTLRGDVTPIPMAVLEIEPRKVSAGEMKVGTPKRLEITMKNVGNADLVIRGISARKAGGIFYDAGRDGPLKMAPGEARKLPISLTAPAEGEFLDYLLIQADARNVTDKGYKVVVLGRAIR